ncbi:MAG: spore germination protein [Clostridia bacterium]|nr:spore germination protein [Clostridia bacterium]
MRLPFLYNSKKHENFVLGENDEYQNGSNRNNTSDKKLSGYYCKDLNLLKTEFSYKKSGDVKLREFTIKINSEDISAALFYIDGLIDKDLLNNFILMPLMVHSREINAENISAVYDVLLPQAEATEDDSISSLSYNLNFGSAILLVNGIAKAISIDIKGWKSKPIGEPQSEKVIRGPNDAFNEQIRFNTALIRRLIRNSDLIVEETKIGNISHTPCSVLYMKNIADDALVKETIWRINSLDIDYIMTSAELEMYIEEKTFSAIPQLLSTERPDRTAKAILDGKVAVLVDGSPYALLLPATFYELNESTEDSYLRYPYANMLRLIRALAFFFSMLLPGLYIAIMNFHNELLPTNLLIAIIAAKEEVPFPGFIELIFMEVALEIIREAGVRVPTPSGSTLSIVGALILGQAAVEASIVSPVVIIVVSLAAIGSFATPNYYLGLAARVMKFVYIFLGGLAGLLGISAGLFIHALLWVHTSSFGVPMFAPFAPRTKHGGFAGIFINPIWKREMRPDIQNPKRKFKEAKISRKWKYK